MNCYYHSEMPAVAQCGKCGKFLCKKCAVESQTILCKECNISLDTAEQLKEKEERERQKSNILISSVIFAIVPLISIVSTGKINIIEVIVWGLTLGGIPYGWRKLSNTKLKCILVLPILGWIFYIAIKLQVSSWIGWFLFIKDIIQYFQKNRR